ncbi:MAG: hypothetical protein OQK52_10340 [Ignavibacteriaceae bacterium]|jgi:hypothetical protein|nr:hypothetical protein [Ignavibacteriaceae bacterium]MCW8961172.1 hypothetical protein [Ignavibacteriaceae bacterium]
MILNRIKRKTTIILAVVFIYNTFGFILVQPLLSKYFEYIGTLKAENPSEEDKIELIILNKEDIESNENNFKKMGSKEFRLNEKYYDIVKQEDRDSLIYFYCISDELENALEKDLQDRFDENSLNKKQKPSHNNNPNTVYSEPVCYLTLDQINSPGSIYRSNKSVHYLQICRDIQTPPPRSI